MVQNTASVIFWEESLRRAMVLLPPLAATTDLGVWGAVSVGGV